MVLREKLARFQLWISPSLVGPPALAFLPALTLGAFWLGGETALVLTSLGLPLLFAVAGAFSRHKPTGLALRDLTTGLVRAEGFDFVLDAVFDETDTSGLRSCCYMIQIDDLTELLERYGPEAIDVVLRKSGQRLTNQLREADVVGRVNENQFAICLAAVAQLDLESCINLAGRLQTAVEEPIALDGLSVYVSCSIGFCLRNRAPGDSSQDRRNAAADALHEAKFAGPSAIRAFAPSSKPKPIDKKALSAAIATALEQGQIIPWFQPQISTDTGKVTGFEALARWNHPKHGMLSPGEFLPLLERDGLLQRLGQTMLFHALTALKAWDNAGIDVPSVAVNFSSVELRDPGMIERLKLELDRVNLTPDRLTIEILETVVTDQPDDVISLNIKGLSEMGCRIDLDDFGTGHASIASIRRFGFARIKIDRSFVMKSDQDPEQQRMIGAILTMAERLEMETLAEGVETVGEHALLAQLGCDHVQGFGIGRPMPFDQTLDWITKHRTKLSETPFIGRSVT